MTRKRRPWLAALLSLVLPGLGQLYAGHAAGAVAAYGATVGALALMGAIWLFVPGGPLVILVGVAIGLGTYLAVILHAWRLAARQRPDFELRPYNRWYVYVGAYVGISLFLGSRLQEALRSRLEAFRIPSGAMEPTLLIGDYLYVVKTSPTRTHVAHGSVVVFESVEEPGLKVVKRVVGLPGDTLTMRAGWLHRNGEVLEEPFTLHLDRSRAEEPEQRARMRAWQVGHVTGPDTLSYAPDLQDWGPLVVPADSFFALGDNRDASYDSRYYGFVPMNRVLGQPRVIYLSLAMDTTGSVTGVRWARMGTRVR